MLNTTKPHGRKSYGFLLPALVSLWGAAALVLATTPLAAQDTPLQEIYAEIEQIKAGNEELRTLLADQRLLNQLAREDPSAARAALKPYSDCANSVLKPYCPWFKGLYAPLAADSGGGLKIKSAPEN